MVRMVDKIGPYQIVETVHRGPQPLYRARGKDGKDVALKAVAVANLSDEARERFKREAATCLALDHPNIVKMFDSGEADGCLYQAMEMLEGADLGKVLAENRHFTWEGKLSIMEQVAEGLEYAHERKLVHRDIKPANLFLENSGRVKVLDFGMVRVAESELTRVNSSLGTLNYMAPEQIRGERCTAAADVFSAGIVFYQLASGRHPFSARDRSLVQVVSAIVFETPPKLSELCPDAPEGLEFILNGALEKDAARRIQNAGDLKQRLGLCRLTLGLAPPPQVAEDAGEKTRVMRVPVPGTGAEPAAPEDPEKTRVIKRQPASPAPAAPPAPAVQSGSPPLLDEEKTQVMKRSAPPSEPAAAPPAPPAAPAKPVSVAQAPPRPAAPSQSISGLRFRYCPTCTTPNQPDATVCARCKAPLIASPGATQTTTQSKQWPLYIAIAVAAILAIALILVLLTKRS